MVDFRANSRQEFSPWPGQVFPDGTRAYEHRGQLLVLPSGVSFIRPTIKARLGLRATPRRPSWES